MPSDEEIRREAELRTQQRREIEFEKAKARC